MDEIEQATKVIENHASQQTINATRAMVAAGEARWLPDPWVPDVVGLVRIVDGVTTDDAYVVVYLDENDFEASELFEERAYEITRGM